MLKVYAYVDGSDLDEVSCQLVEAFTNFLHTWGISSARVDIIFVPDGSGDTTGIRNRWV